MSPNTVGCGEMHNATALSFTTASLSAGISISTVILNGLIIIIFIRQRKTLFRQLFYKVIFNILLSDFLNGLITDTLTLTYVIKEGLKHPVSEILVTMSHITFFIFGSVSVVTIGLLGAERQWALFLPFSYRVGVEPIYVYGTLVSTWILSILMSLLYLWLGFYTSLVIFASTTVCLSFVIMLVTVIAYYHKLIRRPAHVGAQDGVSYLPRSQGEGEIHMDLSMHVTSIGTAKSSPFTIARLNRAFSVREGGSSNDNNNRPNRQRAMTDPLGAAWDSVALSRPRLTRRNAKPLYCKHVATEAEKRATKTFIIILIVFIVSYMPTCVMMVYMNICRKCNCMLIHILRDMTYLSMVSGCLLRPINFIFSLKPLKTAISKLCGCNPNTDLTAT